MIDAHMLILDREIRGLVMTNAEDFDAEAVRLRAVARATEIRVAQAQAGWRK